MSHEGLAEAFRAYADPTALADLRAELDPDAVPTWRDFAHGVAEAVASA